MEEEVNVCVREHTKYKGVEEKLGKGLVMWCMFRREGLIS